MAEKSEMKAKPRILFVGPMLGCHPGWVPNPAEILAPHFTRAGYTCLLTSKVLNRYARLIHIVRTLIRERKRYNIVSLQVYFGASLVVEDIASSIARALGKKVVMVMHGGDIPVFMRRFPNWSQRVLRRAHALVTPSTYLQQALLQYGYQARVIPNMLDMDKYPFRLRKKVQPRLLWMRTFYDYCHPEFAVEVLEILTNRYPNACLTMSGQDKGLLPAIVKLVSQKNLQGKVRFPGFLNEEDKQREFTTHDIYLNTNQIDNMPIAAVESAAFGLPVVAMSVGGIPYMLTNEKNALLTLFGDVQAMANAVIRLVEAPHLAAHLSHQGRLLAEQSAWENVFPLWDKVYKQVYGEN